MLVCLCGGHVTIGCLSLFVVGVSQYDVCVSLWWACRNRMLVYLLWLCHNRMLVSLCGGRVKMGCLSLSVVGVSQ